MPDPATTSDRGETTNGAAWAAALAAAVGGAAFAGLTVLSEASGTAGRLLQWYRPAGSLSGVATATVLIWAGAWFALHRRWRGRDLQRQRMLLAVTGALVAVALLGTFPPIYDLF